MIKFYCIKCGQPIEGVDEWAGRHVNCPSCSTPLVVPGGEHPNLSAGRQLLEPIVFSCCYCGHNVDAPQESVGTAVSCPHCFGEVLVPDPEHSPTLMQHEKSNAEDSEIQAVLNKGIIKNLLGLGAIIGCLVLFGDFLPSDGPIGHGLVMGVLTAIIFTIVNVVKMLMLKKELRKLR